MLVRKKPIEGHFMDLLRYAWFTTTLNIIRSKNILSLLVFVLLSGQSVYAQPITKANWNDHPQIKQIRQLVNDVDKKIKMGVFHVDERIFCSKESGWPEVKIASDDTGKVRMYHWLNCGEDSCNQETRYYDEGGGIRFVHFTRRAVNNFMAGESRVYLNENGNIIWEKIETGVFDEIYEPPDRKGLRSNPSEDFKKIIMDNKDAGNREVPRGKNQLKFCN